MKNNTFKSLIVICCLTAMIALSMRPNNLASATPIQSADIPGYLFEEQWAGIYRSGEKVGYTMSKLSEEGDGFRASELAYMKISVMGVEKDIRMTTDAHLDKSFILKRFTFNLESDINMNIEGRIEGSTMQATMTTGGSSSSVTVHLDKDPFISLSLAPMLKEKGLEPGTTISFPVIDPSTLTLDSLELTVEGMEPLTVMGKQEKTYKLNGTFKGMTMQLWASEDGEILRQEVTGLTFVKENKADAIQMGKSSIDLIADMAVPFNLKLPPDVSYMKVRIEGIDTRMLELDGGNQKFNEGVLEIHRTDMPPSAGENKPVETESYLRETLFVESRDPEIVSLADEIVGDEKDTFHKARLIYDWVYKNIQKAPIMSIPRSTAVLRSRKGDCNEHTTLYTALARAADVPTRITVGLVYQDGRFYYHAWPEVYVGGWFALDPTLGQWPADASHIRLLTGGLDMQLRLSSVFGQIRMTGLEFR